MPGASASPRISSARGTGDKSARGAEQKPTRLGKAKPLSVSTPRGKARSLSGRLNLSVPAIQSPFKVAVVRSPSKSKHRSWVPSWGKVTRGKGDDRPPALVAQASADLVLETRSKELADTVFAAAVTAADTAHEMGLTDAQAVTFYNNVVRAAANILDPGGSASATNASASTDGEARGGESVAAATTRLEAILARAIKKSAVRVVDLFQDWDQDRSGGITRKELRSALLGTGMNASSAEIDALFQKWDVDRSGSIDYTELNKALKSLGGATPSGISRELSDRAAREAESVVLLGRGAKAAAVKQAKEAKDAAREARLALSPRSQQLKAAAERLEQQVTRASSIEHRALVPPPTCTQRP